MRLPFSKAFRTSLILHGSLLFCLLATTITPSCPKKTKVHTFTLQSPPAQSPSPEKTIAKAQPKPEPKKTPEPKPIAKKPEPKPEPTPKKTPEAKTTQVAYNDFLKTQKPKPKATPKKTTPAATPKLTPTPTVAPPKIQSNLDLSDLPSLSTHDLIVDDLSAYISQLKSQIDTHWNLPDNPQGYQHETTVAFTLSPTGQLQNITIKHSSGSPEFDQSILNAFYAINTTSPPPTQKPQTFQLAFNLHKN